jgi:hypothetical protein
MTPARRTDLGLHKVDAQRLMLERSFPAGGSSHESGARCVNGNEI